MLTVLSLGAGVQSSTLLLMAERGVVTPAPDCAIIADTKDEPEAVYRHLAWLRTATSIPIQQVSRGHLWDSATRIKRTRDGLRTYVPTGLPVFVKNGDGTKGFGKRQCTRTFKIDVINATIRSILGLKRIPARSGILAEVWIGISTDEASRMKPSDKPWIRTRWPLIEKNMSRKDCLAWMAAHGYPEPPKSACTYCPFHDDAGWLALTADEFADAVEKEKQLQAAYAETSEFKGVPFFHRSRVPLSEVSFRPVESDRQLNMFNNECLGICGV